MVPCQVWTRGRRAAKLRAHAPDVVAVLGSGDKGHRPLLLAVEAAGAEAVEGVQLISKARRSLMRLSAH